MEKREHWRDFKKDEIRQEEKILKRIRENEKDNCDTTTTILPIKRSERGNNRMAPAEMPGM